MVCIVSSNTGFATNTSVAMLTFTNNCHIKRHGLLCPDLLRDKVQVLRISKYSDINSPCLSVPFFTVYEFLCCHLS